MTRCFEEKQPTIDAALSAVTINQGCACRTLDPNRLQAQLEADPLLAGLYGNVVLSRPQLFSATSVFISPEQSQRMADIVSAVGLVATSPAYQRAVLDRAPHIARRAHGPQGVFMGFDFHLGANGPRLIEINTNAGGPLLNAVLARAQQACCDEMAPLFTPQAQQKHLEDTYFSMFAEEWHRARGTTPLGRIAIVDDAPASQYLFPEFKLFQRLFSNFGVEAVIADARQLVWNNGMLWYEGERIDLVYNRLTDFYLEEHEHAALCQAYEADAIVLTPDPRAHALYADKRNLVTLSDDKHLSALGVPESVRSLLTTGVSLTVPVTLQQADELWAQRRDLFFKPNSGYGSKAVYRGDKLTHRVWKDILAGDYVAQSLVRPGNRIVRVDETDQNLKFDVRAYAYAGKIQLIAARLYAGQTTNFRTPGGGFAPVFVTR
ncbi:MAG TPA: hypothetical protein VMV50_01885 [Candidatus Paceibacterota bacterium]|nr:hypothetical protein [Candidatus Paceibacterota bacterium]